MTESSPEDDGQGSDRTRRDAPRWVIMDGILDGRIADGPAITKAVVGLNALGICGFDLDQDGGKFSLMPDNQRASGARFGSERQELLLQHLQAIAAATRGAVESTLRCTMVFEDEVAETLFRAVAPPPQGPGVEPLTRVRPVGAGDVPVELPAAPPWRQMLRRKEVAIVVPLLIVAFGLLAWRSGLIDRLLAANAQGIEVRTGVFGDLIEASVESSWGNYEVTVRRGSGYPMSSAEWDARAATATTESDRLRDTVVREGQEVWVQLRDAQDEVLVEGTVSLRPLVTESDAELEVTLPGRITASRVFFSVNKREKK